MSPTKRRLPPPIPIAIVALSLLSCSVCGITLENTPATVREFQLEDLFLPASSFPEGWRRSSDTPREACSASPLGSGCPTYGETLDYTDRYSEHRATETIYHFRIPDWAASDFDDVIELEFTSSQYAQPWQETSYPESLAPGATNSYLACREGPRGPECQFAARYEEFVVVLNIQTDGVGDSQLADLLLAIDERMTSFLY